MKERIYTALFPFGGMGGGGLGFKEATAHLFGTSARFRVIGGIDFEKLACQDFEKLVGAPSLCVDIKHLSAHELRQICPETPDVVFLSPPCKGSSALLGIEKSKTPKYQAMNQLAAVWIELMLSAWDRPPRLVLLENVPRLKQRAASMLAKVRSMLRRAGYVLHDGFHECGELGGLAQVRKRYLLVARHASSTAPLLYQPPKKRVRACGEVLGSLPLPGDPAAGLMHALPKLSWLNWVRLSLIPAGGDWRDLEGVLRDGQPRREVFRRHGVQRWEEPSPTVAGSGSNGPVAVADPRTKERFGNVQRVNGWDDTAPTVTAGTHPMNGGQSVADPRVDRFKGSMGVRHWSEPAATVTGESHPSNGSNSVADPRLGASLGTHHNKMRIEDWSKSAHTVTGSDRVGSGAPSVADIRVPRAFDHGYGVLNWAEPSSTIAGGSQVGQGAYSVADLRFKGEYYRGTYGVLSWEEAAGTITGSARIDTGKFAVADPRKPPPFLPMIIAADGTWHRPITTLECAVLQSFPAIVDGEPLVLSGKSVSGYRERIGNAVPPKTAQAIAEQMLVTLLQADLGAFSLSSSGDVWVDRVADQAQ